MFLVAAVIRRGRPGQIPLLDIGVFNAICLLAALQCVRGRFEHPGVARAWRCVAAALGANVAGNLYFSLITEHQAELLAAEEAKT